MRSAALLTAVALVGIACGTPVSAFGEAWDEVGDGQWYVRYLQLDEAHKISKGKGIVIAVIDTGVDATHPDIAGSVVPGTDTSRASPSDGLTDAVGHGTGMAGLIVGHGRIRGVAPEATVMAIRAETGASGSSTAVGAALRWAVRNGAMIASISIASQDADEVLRQAVENALSSNVIVVAAAGNRSKGEAVGYPAAYPGVVAVGGVGPDGQASAAAVSGEQIVLSAPCDRISTPWLKHQRMVGTGTSNSAALVAGAAALVRARYPQMPAREVVHRLTATAVDRGPSGRDERYGYGVVDVVAALTASVPPLPEGSGAPSVTPSSVELAAPGAKIPVAIALLVTGIAAAIGALILATLASILVIRQRRP